ncbi:MAG: SGNH/GDSL hydrolase family protein [Candidatus Limivicinus sp.]|jgi:hypothetical protein
MYHIGNVFIMGDSYSAFDGCTTAENIFYYPRAGEKEMDVDRKEQMWFDIVLREQGGQLVLNNSVSGSTVCNTGYDGEDYPHSFVRRTEKYCSSGFFSSRRIDTVFVFGGTNDSWAGSPLGEIKYGGWTDGDKYRSLPAFSYVLCSLKKALPAAHIIPILNCDINEELRTAYREIAEHFELRCVSLHNISKVGGHPNAEGMRQIAAQVTEVLESIE